MAARGTTLLALLALVASLVGCDINPVPEPPSQQLQPPDTALITLDPDISMAGDEVDIVGAPGAAEPGDRIWAVNLDGTAPPVNVDVQPDGSFEVTLVGFTGDEVRLQARDGDLRSDPVDVMVPMVQGPAVLAQRPLSDCLLLDPPLELVLPSPSGAEAPEAVLAIENRCSQPVTFGEQRLRVASDAFVIEPAQSDLPPGGFGQVVVRAYGDPAESILLLHVQAPASERRPITLVSQGGATGLMPTCGEVGGVCTSDPMDPTFPALCESFGQQTLQASCAAFNEACCDAAP